MKNISTYLLTWNPAKYSWDDIASMKFQFMASSIGIGVAAAVKN
jgi:hypothetical protein